MWRSLYDLFRRHCIFARTAFFRTICKVLVPLAYNEGQRNLTNNMRAYSTANSLSMDRRRENVDASFAVTLTALTRKDQKVEYLLTGIAI